MRIYRYWSRARCDLEGREGAGGGVVGVGWSQTSEAEAQRHARQRAQETAGMLRRGEHPRGHWAYYPDRPIREPVVDELRAADRLLGAITRNIYGAYVLNAAETMFVDIDDAPAASVGGLLGRLFGKKQPGSAGGVPQRVAEIIQQTPGLTMRVYRTAGGYRGIVTSRTFDPTSARTLQLLESFGSDRLYVQLCKAQQCFRARLSPKPWRCGLGNPPRSYPWISNAKQQQFEHWSRRYDEAITEYAVCRYLDTVGSAAVHPNVEPVLKMHDELTCTGVGQLA